MKLLVLGKTGQVGWELQRALAPLGEVMALSRADGDLSAPSFLQSAIAAVAPDVIVNGAAYTAVDKAETEPELADRVNHGAVAALADVARQRGALLVHYSTDYVFDGTKTSSYSEDDATSPQSVYGRTKLAGDEAVLVSGCQHLILRTSWVFASRGRNFVRTILRAAGERDELRVVSDQIGAPTGAELIADVTAHAIRGVRAGAPGGVYNLTASGETSWHGLATFIVEEAMARGASLKTTPQTIKPINTIEYGAPAPRPANSRLDTHKLRAAFGLELPDWQVGVRRVVAELLEH